MKKIRFTQADFEASLKGLYNRPSYPPEIELQVQTIIAEVKVNGDAALMKFAEKFDKVKLTPANFKVTAREIDEAKKLIGKEEKRAIKLALANVRDFAKRGIPRNWTYSPRPGVTLGEQFNPMQRVGVYIPGGTAPLVSTVIHTAGIASAVGVKEIVAVTPANSQGKVHPAVLYAMSQAGVTEIYRLGGVYGIAALALGTPSIAKVEKIVGPGNAYVTAAKKLLYGQAAIDMVAGPSEILVIADGGANAEFIAADLLSQAEHGSGLEQAVLLTDCADLLERVAEAVQVQKLSLSRSAAVEKVLNNGVFLIQTRDLAQACEIASKYAPEHLEIQTANPEKLAKRITAAGALFLGAYTPEPAGDFCAGPSHVLPTASSARYFNGLSSESFIRRSSVLKYSKSALKKEVFAIAKFAQMEGLDAHGRSGTIRFEGEK